MTTGRAQPLTISNVGYWCAVVHQVPRSFVVLASVHDHTEFVVDSFRNVQSMKLGMHNPWQATIKLPGVADNTCRSVQHSLQSVCNSLRRPGENRVAVVDTWRHESVDECCSRHGVKWTPDRTRRSWRSRKKPAAQTLLTCLSRLRSDEIVTPRRRCQLALTISAPSRKPGPQPARSERLCFEKYQVKTRQTCLMCCWSWSPEPMLGPTYFKIFIVHGKLLCACVVATAAMSLNKSFILVGSLNGY